MLIRHTPFHRQRKTEEPKQSERRFNIPNVSSGLLHAANRRTSIISSCVFRVCAGAFVFGASCGSSRLVQVYPRPGRCSCYIRSRHSIPVPALVLPVAGEDQGESGGLYRQIRDLAALEHLTVSGSDTETLRKTRKCGSLPSWPRCCGVPCCHHVVSHAVV